MRNFSALFLLLASSGSVLAGGFAAPIAAQSSSLVPPPILLDSMNATQPQEKLPAAVVPPTTAPTSAASAPAVVEPQQAAATGVRIVVDQTSGARRLVLPQNILFPVDDAALNAGYDAMMAQIAQVLQANPEIRLNVVGHTDNTATDSFNMGLSVARANGVVKALVAKGVDSKRLVVTGKGETQPIADNTTEAGRAANRRTEILLIQP